MPFNKLIQKNKEFWTRDRSLSALLVYVIVNTFLVIPFVHFRAGEISYSVIYSLILVSGVFAFGAGLHAKLAILLLAIVSFIVRWMLLIHPVAPVRIADDILSITFYACLIAFVTWHIFREGDITFHRIQGAIAVYMIIGLIFSKAYHLIFLLDPNAFTMPTLQEDAESFYSRFIYFSYVTMTTLGYGDIIAVNLGAKSLVMIEGLIGQLFPAIMITRLVTLELEYRKNRKG
ncbi:MAG: two pore domain potassium channel family protein [Cyclobacteriaceae bacterium]|nr:two pore domain potassium channel family protein [Cyclobacteriaceae bacterium]